MEENLYVPITEEMWPLFYRGRLTAVILAGTPNGSCVPGSFQISDGDRREPIVIRRVVVANFADLTADEVQSACLGHDPLEALRMAMPAHLVPIWDAQSQPVTVLQFERRMDG